MHDKHNLYPGVNAHLNSLLQSEPGGWSNFHAEHIIEVRRALDEVLPAGYFARSETSLQIEAFDAGTGVDRRLFTHPDVTVYRQSSTPLSRETSEPEAAGVPLVLELLDTLPEEDTFTGVVIYQVGEGGLLGRPVARVEVLSPANKRGASHYSLYMSKRLSTLRSGLSVVELDYLHHTAPVIRGLSSYADGEAGAFPYHIIVSDPHPTLEEGQVHVYGIGVLQALPAVRIPLVGTDVVFLNMNEVYNRTFSGTRFFTLVVDYAQDIAAFERYHAADRERLTAFLQVIRERGDAQ